MTDRVSVMSNGGKEPIAATVGGPIKSPLIVFLRTGLVGARPMPYTVDNRGLLLLGAAVFTLNPSVTQDVTITVFTAKGTMPFTPVDTGFHITLPKNSSYATVTGGLRLEPLSFVWPEPLTTPIRDLYNISITLQVF